MSLSHPPSLLLRSPCKIFIAFLFSSKIVFWGLLFFFNMDWLHSPQSIQTFITLTVHKQWFFKENQCWRDRVKFTMQMKRNTIEIVCVDSAEKERLKWIFKCAWYELYELHSFIPCALTVAQMFIVLCVLLALPGKNTFIILWVIGVLLKMTPAVRWDYESD